MWCVGLRPCGVLYPQGSACGQVGLSSPASAAFRVMCTPPCGSGVAGCRACCAQRGERGGRAGGYPLTEDSHNDDGCQTQQRCNDGNSHFFEGLQGAAGFGLTGGTCEGKGRPRVSAQGPPPRPPAPRAEPWGCFETLWGQPGAIPADQVGYQSVPIPSLPVHPPPVHPTSCSLHCLFSPLTAHSTSCAHLTACVHPPFTGAHWEHPVQGVLHTFDLTCSRKFLWLSSVNLHLALPEEARTCLASLSPLVFPVCLWLLERADFAWQS